MTQATPVKTILAATDFSETGDGAITWAAGLARLHGARLVLVHALLPANPAPAPEFMPLPSRFFDELRSAAEARLESLAERERSGGLALEVDLSVGHAAEVVVRRATALRADLIVVGTRGLTGWKKLLLGSTAAGILRHSPCPVLAVHPEEAAKPFVHPQVVLVPTDFSPDARHALEAVATLLSPAKVRLHLLHTFHVPTEYLTPLPVPVILEDVDSIAAAARVEMAPLADRARALGFETEATVTEGYPPEAILEKAGQLGAEMIAMGTHGRSAIRRMIVGSTTERVLPQARCPVLAVPPPKPRE